MKFNVRKAEDLLYDSKWHIQDHDNKYQFQGVFKSVKPDELTFYLFPRAAGSNSRGTYTFPAGSNFTLHKLKLDADKKEWVYTKDIIGWKDITENDDDDYEEEKEMMKTVDLFTVKNKGLISNIIISDIPLGLNKLETKCMTLRSTDENNEHTGIDIKLVDVNPKSGFALFRVDDNNSGPTEFVIKSEDDPVVEFVDNLGMEYHVFDNVVQYEINQEIKQGRLYKFQNPFNNEWFLAVVQSVGPSLITLEKLDVVRNTKFTPTKYTVYQRGTLFSIIASDTDTVEKFKNYVVTELCDLTIMFNYD